MIAREPITRLCIRHIIRELVSLEWKIVSANPKKDAEQIKKLTNVLENADEGEGWDAWLSRVLEDAMTLPMGGNSELVPDRISGMLGALVHIDSATLYPTYEPELPYVQINPYNTTERIYFVAGDVMRLMLQPRPDIQRKPFQEAPPEAAFVGIEALSRMYVYYLKQLTDTPIMGVLDLMDMTQDEAVDWAKGFREMLDGIDPLKMPLLYDHTRPARFVPLGRSPQDINMIEQFKRFAEIVTAAFGLSIGDLRLFEHERVLAGVEASQRVTARSGIGFYAQHVEDMLNRSVLFSTMSGFTFKFLLGMTGEDQQKAMLDQSRVSILTQLAGATQALVKPEDAQAQLKAWGVIDVELHGIPQPPGLEGLGAIMGGGGGGAQQQQLEQQPEAGAEGNYNFGGDENDWGGYGKSLVNEIFARKSLSQVEMLPLIDKAVKIVQAAFGQVAEKDASQDDWWVLPDISVEMTNILTKAFDAAVLESMQSIQKRGYALGIANGYQPNVMSFHLKDLGILDIIRKHAEDVLVYIDEGTEYYLKQWDDSNKAQTEIFGKGSTLSNNRITSIVAAELAWARGFAQYLLLKNSGFLYKIWVNDSDNPDEFSLAAANMGTVNVDYLYTSRFGDKIAFPPADTRTTDCRLLPTDDEVKEFFENNRSYWQGADSNLAQSKVEGVMDADPVEIPERSYQHTSILA